MAWVYLLFAGLFEVVWALALKESKNFTQLIPSVITVLGMGASIWLLSLALKTLPIGTSYAIWTGIGALGALLAGMLFLGESASLPKVGFALLLIVSLVGLKLTSAV